MARASSVSKAGKGFSGQEQAANKPRAIQGTGGPNKAASGQPLASSRKGGPAARRGETSSLMYGSIPRPSESSKQPSPLGLGEAADSRDPGGGLQGGPG